MANAPDTSAKIDMTPMIDCVFLLLIFFMVGTRFKREEGRFRSYLPKDRGLSGGPPKIDLSEMRIKILWYDLATGAPTDDPDPERAKAVLKVVQEVYPEVEYTDTRQGLRYPIPDYDYLYQKILESKANYRNDRDPSKTLPVIIDARPQVPAKYVVWALNACVRAQVTDVTFAAAGKPID